MNTKQHTINEPVTLSGVGLHTGVKVNMTFVPADGSKPVEYNVFDFQSSGIAMGMYNMDDSIRDFARASLNYGLNRNFPVYLSTKNTILKAYDGRFKDIFEEIYQKEFKKY